MMKDVAAFAIKKKTPPHTSQEEKRKKYVH